MQAVQEIPPQRSHLWSRSIVGECGIVQDRRFLGYTFSQLLLRREVINTVEPENVKAILATQFKDFSLPPTRKAASTVLLGHGIFNSDGAAWETSRSLLRPNFVRSQVGDLDTFEKHITHLIARIPRDGSTVDLQPLFFMLTMDSATEFLFGESTGVLLGGDASVKGEMFSDAFTYAQERIGLEGRVGKVVNLFPNKRYKNSLNYVHEYVGNYVEKAVELRKANFNVEKKEGQKYVFLEQLAGTGVDKKKIQDELMNILLAGRDTTASLLSYTFYILARRPDVLEKLRAEVLSLGSGRPTFEQLKSLKYLQYTLNEGTKILFPPNLYITNLF
jgi:cytochrome P450